MTILDMCHSLVYALAIMLKNSVRNIRRLGAASVFGFGFCLFGLVLATGLSWADETVPVPARKPGVGEPKGQVIHYTLENFTKALLAYGEPPVPKSKPLVIGEGPLPSEEAARYKNVFALQAAGKIKEADRELAEVRDMRLRGHVLYQRYMHPTAYTSSFDELVNWMVLYADHPGAHKIYKLANRKIPNNFKGTIKKPEGSVSIVRMREPMMTAGRKYRSQNNRSAQDQEQIKKFKDSIFYLVNQTRPTQAHKKLQESTTSKLLDSVEYDLLQSRIAAGYLHAGKMGRAYELAFESAQNSGLHAPMAGWVAGLVAWKKGEYAQAAQLFEIPARSSYASSWTAAAGSYWAARAHMRTGNVKAVSIWLKRAKTHPRTFYGLLATRALGQDFDFNWGVPTYTKVYHDRLAETAAGKRAMALVDAGQIHLAEAELKRLNPKGDEDLTNALLSYAGYAGLPALAMRLGSALIGPEGDYYDAALYPMGPWEPREGYKIDPALIHAIMRQESRFDPMAESPSGARGLMQLMPTTASYVAKRGKLKLQEGQHELVDPEINLEIGQKYLSNLLRDRYVDGDLLSLLIAYNAGPGNLARWRKEWPEVEDPLLFIELIPSRETRAYVERVLANYWIYRLREDLKTPTMDALAEGRAAHYAAAGYIAPYQLAENR